MAGEGVDVVIMVHGGVGPRHEAGVMSTCNRVEELGWIPSRVGAGGNIIEEGNVLLELLLVVSEDRVGAGGGGGGDTDVGGSGTGTGGGGGCKWVGDSTPSKKGEREIRLLEVASSSSSLSSSDVCCCTKVDR